MTYQIAPASPDVAGTEKGSIYDWGGAKNIVEGKNTDIYNTAAFYPEPAARLLPYSQMRKWPKSCHKERLWNLLEKLRRHCND